MITQTCTPVRMGSFDFPLMREIIPENVSGNCAIKHFTISESDASLYNLRAAFHPSPMGGVSVGEFCSLMIDDGLIASDADGERRSAYWVCEKAHGRVLIAGLGIGMILTKIVPNPGVENVTVVEISQDVINLVENPIREYLNGHSGKLAIIHSDIYAFVPPHKYDTIWFDIWGNYSGDTYEETKRLHIEFKHALDRTHTPNPYMDSWMRDHMKYLHFRK